MRDGPESPENQKTYRAARRAFIAACEKAHVETVARLHPAKAPDGKPLFMDAAALGLRRAPKAALVVAYDATGTDMLIALLRETPPPGAKVVLVHAFDPAIFAGVAGDPAWPPAMLGVVVTEDLPWTRELAVQALGRCDENLKPLLQARLPDAKITVLPPATSATRARDAITAFFAAL